MGIMTIEESLNLAVQSHQAGDLARAQDLYRQVLMKEPKTADAWHLLGVLHYQSGDSNTALELIKKAIALKPVTMDYYYNLGLVYKTMGRNAEAVSTFHRASMLPSTGTGILKQLSKGLIEVRQWADAESCLKQVLSAQADDPDALALFGNMLADIGRFDDAMKIFEKLLALQPANDWVRWNHASMHLLHGRFAEGWPGFERRLVLPGGPSVRQFNQPRWDGADAPGKTIFVHAEGGYGDTLQYVRFVPMLRGRFGRVILECQAGLKALCESISGVDEVIERNLEQPLPAFDLQIAMPSFGPVFKIDLTNIPNTVPYLTVPPDRLDAWKSRVSSDGAFKVGLCWSGNRGSPNDHMRTNSLELFAPLAALSGVRFYSLQVGAEAAQPRPAGLEIVDFTPDIRDFADTAALISQLDLVISVETAVAHLAGALARKVWTLIPFVPPPRWLLNRTDSPWYPTMRLFRQKKLDDWSAPIAEVVEGLKGIK
jgi:Flp pilus assembly protein TadD